MLPAMNLRVSLMSSLRYNAVEVKLPRLLLEDPDPRREALLNQQAAYIKKIAEEEIIARMGLVLADLGPPKRKPWYILLRQRWMAWWRWTIMHRLEATWRTLTTGYCGNCDPY